MINGASHREVKGMRSDQNALRAKLTDHTKPGQGIPFVTTSFLSKEETPHFAPFS